MKYIDSPKSKDSTLEDFTKNMDPKELKKLREEVNQKIALNKTIEKWKSESDAVKQF